MFTDIATDRIPIPNSLPANTVLISSDANKRTDNVENSVAKRRWGLLAKALQSPTLLLTDVDKISLRRFSSYTLVECHPVQDSCNNCLEAGWFEYRAQLDRRWYCVVISHPQRAFTPAELSGFNNTGNICVWPSEETLAYYALANAPLFTGRTVLELGGGMSCLAGLMIAAHLRPGCVHLTDGNATAIENVHRSIQNNAAHAVATCSVLKWDRNENDKETVVYDIIVCADCLFFDESRLDLIETIWNRLADTGLALVMAPKRGNTLQEFVIQARYRGFLCRKMLYYNKRVWERHVALLDNPDYDENRHYPLLIQMTKLANYTHISN